MLSAVLTRCLLEAVGIRPWKCRLRLGFLRVGTADVGGASTSDLDFASVAATAASNSAVENTGGFLVALRAPLTARL